MEDQFTRVFSSVKPVERRIAGLSSSTSLVMGGPIKLTDHPVIDIQSNSGRYWRAAVYDRYTGSGWLSNHNDTVSLVPGDSRLGTRTDDLRTIITQTIQVRTSDPSYILYAAAQPVQFDLPIEIRYSKANSERGTFGFDLASARSRRILRENDTYTVVSALTRADEESLRATGLNFNYPAWFASDYLQLPDRVPPRLSNLAKVITQAQGNQFDKAIAIETFLRKNIKYSETVAPPPTGRDAVDYLLFDRPEGYCNYYASAMAVLARIVGIPARVASGYTQGEYRNGVNHILEKDAHAWPELYFPGYGWIEFEPTASKPEIVRPKNPGSGQSTNGDSADADERLRGDDRNTEIPDDDLGANGSPFNLQLPFWSDPFNFAIVVLGSVSAVGSLGFVVTQWNRSRKLAHLPPAARTYEEMLTRASWLGVRDGVYSTPLERADALAIKMPAARQSIERIASVYSHEKFGAWKPRMTERAVLVADWAQVRGAWWSALAARVIAYLRSLPPGFALKVEKLLKRIHL
jgi:transglutaminase-like putative cysteine protease